MPATRIPQLLESSNVSKLAGTNPGVRTNLEIYSKIEVDGLVTGVSGDLTALTTSVNTISGDLNLLEVTVSNLTTTTNTISGDLNLLETTVSTLSSDLSATNSLVVSVSGDLQSDLYNLDLSLTQSITDCVHKTGVETISGNKTFVDQVDISAASINHNSNAGDSLATIISTNANGGTYTTYQVMGTNGYGITDWIKATLIESVGASANTGNLVLSSYNGKILFQVGGRTTVGEIDATGVLILKNNGTPTGVAAGAVAIGGGTIRTAGSIFVGGGGAADVSVPALQLSNNRILTLLDSTGAYTNCGFLWYDSNNKLNIGAGNATRISIRADGIVSINCTPDTSYGTSCTWVNQFATVASQFNVHTTVAAQYEFVNRNNFGFDFYTHSGGYLAMSIADNKDVTCNGQLNVASTIYAKGGGANIRVYRDGTDTYDWGIFNSGDSLIIRNWGGNTTYGYIRLGSPVVTSSDLTVLGKITSELSSSDANLAVFKNSYASGLCYTSLELSGFYPVGRIITTQNAASYVSGIMTLEVMNSTNNAWTSSMTFHRNGTIYAPGIMEIGTILGTSGGACFSLTPGSVDHCYMQFYPRTSNPSTRGAYFGFAGTAHTVFTMANEIGYFSLNSSVAPTTIDGGSVRVGAGFVLIDNDRGIKIGSEYRLYGDVNYTHIKGPAGTTKLYVGNSDTYYDNDAHWFRTAAGSAGGTVNAAYLYATSDIKAGADVIMETGAAYFGATLTDGTVRIRKATNSLVVERRSGGTYSTIATLATW